eukprot:scaffold109333_cov27-Tisochrysis_lutea.AAC.1
MEPDRVRLGVDHQTGLRELKLCFACVAQGVGRACALDHYRPMHRLQALAAEVPHGGVVRVDLDHLGHRRQRFGV